MTLKSRNSLLKLFLFFSVLVIVTGTIFFLVNALQYPILNPPDLRMPAFIDKIPFLKKDFMALMISFAAIILYVPIVIILSLRFFENTQTSELIFFCGFLLSCLCELFRFFIICLGLWQTFSTVLIFSGKVVLFGRILAPLSFVLASVLSENDYRQDVERNFTILIAIAITGAVIIPLNTAKISSTGMVLEGFLVLMNSLKLLMVALTFFSFYINGIKHDTVEYKKIAYSFLILFIGYQILLYSDNYVMLLLGTASLYSGTILFFINLHKLYLWN